MPKKRIPDSLGPKDAPDPMPDRVQAQFTHQIDQAMTALRKKRRRLAGSLRGIRVLLKARRGRKTVPVPFAQLHDAAMGLEFAILLSDFRREGVTL